MEDHETEEEQEKWEHEKQHRREVDEKDRLAWEDEKSKRRDDLQIKFPGGGIFVPSNYSAGIRPYLRWMVYAVAAGGFIIMVCYGISLVMQ